LLEPHTRQDMATEKTGSYWDIGRGRKWTSRKANRVEYPTSSLS
jgi:hypothetical protein